MVLFLNCSQSNIQIAKLACAVATQRDSQCTMHLHTCGRSKVFSCLHISLNTLTPYGILFFNCSTSVYIFLLTDLLPMALCDCCSCVNSCLLHSNHILYCLLFQEFLNLHIMKLRFMNMKSVYMHGHLEFSLGVQR